jgi:hypothetical protein
MSSEDAAWAVGGAVREALERLDSSWLLSPERRAEVIQKVLRAVLGLAFLNEAPAGDLEIGGKKLLLPGSKQDLRRCYRSLAGRGDIRRPAYLIAHYRHIGLPESRATITLLGEGAQSRTWGTFSRPLPGLKRENTEELSKLHNRFAAIYFGSIGRADSFTDALVRALTWSKRPRHEAKGNHQYPWPLRDVEVVRLCFSDETKLVTVEEPDDRVYTIVVGNTLAKQLRETGEDFKLDDKFFEYVAREGGTPIAAGTGRSPANRSAEDHIRTLRERNILQTREALLDFAAHGAYHDKALQYTLLHIHAALFPEADQELAAEVGDATRIFADHVKDASEKGELLLMPDSTFAKWRIAALRRVLASLQSASLFAQTGDDDFFVYLRQPVGDQPNALPGALALGGAEHLNKQKRTYILDVVQSAFSAIDSRMSSEHSTGRNLAVRCLHGDVVNPPDESESIRQIEQSLVATHETFTEPTFWGAMYLALQLVGRKHEGHPLQFRLAVASDERLRQYFNVIHSVAAPAEDDEQFNHFEVSLVDPTSAQNEIKRIGALLEANYPFLQDPGLFACCAVTALGSEKPVSAPDGEHKLRPGLVLRYLGVPNPRYRDLVTMHEGAPWSDRFNRHTMERLSRSMREVLLVLCDAHGRGHTLLDGRLAFSAVNSRSGWVYKEKTTDIESRLLEGLRRVTATAHPNGSHPLVNFLTADRFAKFAEKLCSIILDLSVDPGAGAALAIGTEKVLLEHMVSMTPVFDVSPGWALGDFRTTDHLFDLAIQDGATGIAIEEDEAKKGGRVLGRMHVKPVLNPEESAAYLLFGKERTESFLSGKEPPPSDVNLEEVRRPWLELWRSEKTRDQVASNPYQWADWGKWYKWGTRHRSAAALAYRARGDVLAVCISQDGHIHLFNGYSIEQWSPDTPPNAVHGVGTTKEPA